MKQVKKIKRRANYIAIKPWMMNLGIDDATELYVYGYVWNLNEGLERALCIGCDEDLFQVSSWIGISANRVRTALNSLIQKHFLINEKEDGVNYISYNESILEEEDDDETI